VVHETIDGEVVLIQLETGNYYTLGGSGPEIWALLGRQHAPAETADRLRSRFDAPAGEIEEAVERLVAELTEEDLLDADDGATAPGDHEDGAGERGPFVEPVLQKYTDMQDFLLVDPIHEVSEAGWPHTQPGVDG
jgi:hypothetical protein